MAFHPESISVSVGRAVAGCFMGGLRSRRYRRCNEARPIADLGTIHLHLLHNTEDLRWERLRLFVRTSTRCCSRETIWNGSILFRTNSVASPFYQWRYSDEPLSFLKPISSDSLYKPPLMTLNDTKCQSMLTWEREKKNLQNPIWYGWDYFANHRQLFRVFTSCLHAEYRTNFCPKNMRQYY